MGAADASVRPYAGLVSLDFTGDNRRGAPQRSNQCGDCYSTQKSVHKSGTSFSGNRSFKALSPYRDFYLFAPPGQSLLMPVDFNPSIPKNRCMRIKGLFE
jgi:hypothetical protein